MLAKTGLVLVALTFATTTLEKLAGTLGLIAGIVVSVGIIYTGGRHLWRFARGLEAVAANTAVLPEFMVEQRAFMVEQRATNARVEEENARVHKRLESGADRMGRIEGAIDAWADAERAAVSAAIEATTAPRPARSTDPPT